MSTYKNMENVVIVQPVSPQDNQPMETQEEQDTYVPFDMPKPLMKFFQGEPEVLGVTQLFIGINYIFFGIIFTMLKDKIFIEVLVGNYVAFWSGIMYVISGSVTLAAFYKPSLRKVNASFVLNTISCMAAMASVVIFAAFFSDMSSHSSFYYHHDYCAYYKQSQTCEMEFIPLTLYKGIASTLLLLTALEFCIAWSTSIFGCKTVCRTSSNDQTVVIYHTTSGRDSKPALSSDEEVQMS